MSDLTAEILSQRITDSGLLDQRQLEKIWGELGTREVSVDQLTSLLLRREVITNFQLDRLVKGERGGYFYGNYKVLYLAGTGTFARVYRAVDPSTEKIVAVKVLRKRFRDDKDSNEQFIREGELGANLRHVNIVPIYEVGKNTAAPYMVMEFVEGRNLREFTKIRKKVAPPEAMKLIIDVLEGLAYAAERGMSHRDLKLSNVLITSRGRAKLVDFGLAAVQARGTDGDDFANARTIDYAGLERASGCRNNDPRSDMFFVGTMLYHMVSGVPAMVETRDRTQRLSMARYSSIKPITMLEPGLPRPLASLISKAIELSPEKRFSSALEMLEEAKRVAAKIASGDVGETPAAAAGRREAAEAAKLPSDQEGFGRTVMVIESKLEMQDLLRERLKKHGYRVLVFSDPDRAINRFRESVDGKVADCVLVCTTDLGEVALNAFNQLGTLPETKRLPAILFADQRHSQIIRGAQLADHRVLHIAPLKVKELRETLLKLLPAVVPEAGK